MATYVAFLRAINLASKRRFGKDDLFAVTSAAGGGVFTDVATYLNTGNVRISTSMRSPARIEQTLEQAYADFTGFDVPTIVLSAADLREVVTVADVLGEGHQGKQFVSFLKSTPTAEAVAGLEARSTDLEQVRVVGRGAHLLLGENYHTSGMGVAVEKHLGPATNRTLGVVRTLVQKWCH